MDLRFQGSFRWRNDFFVETEYEVRVALVNRDTNMVVSRSGDLKCDLRTNPSVPSSRQADALVILQPGAKLKDGVAKFSVKIKSEACRSGMLYLVVSPPDTIEAGNAVSTSFDALQYKLKVAPFPMPHPCVFVQRDAKQRLELNISLQDSKDKIVTDCDVPLEFSVLKVFPSGEREVEEETDKFLTIQQSNNLLNKLHKGKAQVYVRLRELSNNHGGCVFIIGVHVNTNDRSESTSGIGSGMSSEVRVISRQSNSSSRKRKKQNQIVEVVEVEEKEEELSKHPAKKPHKCPPCPVPKQIGQDAIKCFQSDASSALNNVTRWASFAVQTLDKIQFELCGYGIGVHGLPDGAYHVRRCPWCFAYCESTHQQKHRKNCSLATMIRLYRAHIPESSKVLSENHAGITTDSNTLPPPPKMIKSDSWTSQGSAKNEDRAADFTSSVRESPGDQMEAWSRLPITRCGTFEIENQDNSLLDKSLPASIFDK